MAIVTTCISGNDVKAAAIVVSALPTGTFDSRNDETPVNKLTAAYYDALYDIRYDDPRYYTGDAVT